MNTASILKWNSLISNVVMCLTDADRMTNSVDSDQSAPSGSV